MIKIITDAASDFSKNELIKYDVIEAKMPVTFEGNTHDVKDEKTFWDGLISGKKSITSQPNPEFFKEEFLKAKNNGDYVICILISSNLSATFQSAINAKNQIEYDGIYVIDSKTASVAEKQIVLYACKLRDLNHSAREIYDLVMAFRKRVRLFACIDSLKYLARSGRISKVTANIGSVLNVKPIITLTEDGHIINHFKSQGIKKAENKLVEILKTFKIDDGFAIIPIYAHEDTNVVSLIEKLNLNGITVSSENLTPIGPVIGTHIGPKGFGVVFVTEK